MFFRATSLGVVRVGDKESKNRKLMRNLTSIMIAAVICIPFGTQAATTPTDSTAAIKQEKQVKLTELVVEGDKSTIVTRTANGEKFYLSKEAKESGNPYIALKEIPTIISNDATSTVTMLNGAAPKILIDGNWENSGINPINPKDIEYVEVIDAPSALPQRGL